ncbi:unnamed protein product [Symbiodinium microadriaticum]|nr:unnamed protein product [Symbiodinium microadriaticum]
MEDGAEPAGSGAEKQAEGTPAEVPAKEDCEEVLAGSGRDFDLVAAGDRADLQARDVEVPCRAFARRNMRPQPVPLVVSVEDVAPGGKPAMTRRDPQRDWSQGYPPPKPRKGGFDMKIRSPVGGAVPRLNSLLVPGEGSINSPYDDPNSPLPFEPIEKDQPMKPWKVLRSHNGNLPVYTRYRKAGSEVLTVVQHFFGDIEAMRKELMQASYRGKCATGADRHLDRLEQWLERRRKARCYKALDAELRHAARAAEILDTVGVQEFLIGPSSRTVESCEALCFEDEEVLAKGVGIPKKMAPRVGHSKIDLLEGEVAALVFEHLPLRTVQALKCAWRGVAMLLPKCLKDGASLWDWACAARQPFQLFRAMDGELCNCLQTVRADPRYSFHVQYWSVPHFLGNTENDRGLLWFVGSLRGWRPRQKEWNQATIAADTAPVFSIHFFPRRDDSSVHPSCTKPSRTPETEDGSQEVAFYDSGMNDLVAVRARDPSLLLKRCGAASMAPSPVMTLGYAVWAAFGFWQTKPPIPLEHPLEVAPRAACLLRVWHLPGLWQVLFDERCVWWQRRRTPCSGGGGCQLRHLGAHGLTFGGALGGSRVALPRGAQKAVEEGLPDCLNLAPEDVDNDARSPSEMHQICAVERFQKALYLRALAALHCEDPGPELFFGTKSGSAQGRSWKVRRQAAPGTELEEIPTVDLRQVLEEQAVEDARQAFKEAATPEGYARLLRLSFANARKLAGLLDAVD